MKIYVIALMTMWSICVNATVDHWETVVYENDTWRYLLPTTIVPSSWNTLGFNDGSWNTGQGGFGYGDGDDNTTFSSTISCYQRIVFNITNTLDIDQLLLNIDYDDAFVAYLNGVEIARANISSIGQPPYNQYADGEHEAMLYQSQSPNYILLNSALIQSTLLNGANVLAIQTHNVTSNSSDLTSRVFLSLGMNVASMTYGSVPPWFIPPTIFSDSNLPIIVINTENGVDIPNEPKVDATMGIIYNGVGNRNYLSDPFNEYFGNIGIEARGSSSQMFPKKQWGFETRDNFGNSNDITVFNMAWDNDWVLYAPYSDKTLMRNMLVYQLGQGLGSYSPRTQACEVVLNGEYQGVYVLVEKIKRKEGKVGTNSILPEDISGNELTGDYIVKVDKFTSGGVAAWTSPFPPYSGASTTTKFQMHDPDLSALNSTQLSYIQQYVTAFEIALNGNNFTDPDVGYAAYIDVNSFVDFFLMNELTKNVDGYRISSFLNKRRTSEGGKLFAGPLWDFNIAFGNADYCEGGLTSGWQVDFYQHCSANEEIPFWWKRLLQDPNFKKKVSCRYRELREGQWNLNAILDKVDTWAAYLDEAQVRNFEHWPIQGTYVWPNNFVGNTYQEDVNYMKQWITNRVSWLDANMFDSCLDLGITDENFAQTKVYPNPGNELINVIFKQTVQEGFIELIDNQGKVVKQQDIKNVKEIQLRTVDLTKGLYQYRGVIDNINFNGKIIVQ